MIYREGRAAIRYHSKAFINPHAKLTRDIGTALARLLLPKQYSVLDPTAATGVRGMRYALEGDAGSVTFLEINASAYKDLERNVKSIPHGVGVRVLNTSVQEFANTAHEKFDLIDLDPFGGAAPYIHDLLKLARDRTAFFVTATDTAVLCGAHAKACARMYDAWPMHNVLSHETGLRILIGYVARAAAQYDSGISVELAFTYMHYMRAMIVLRHGAKSVDATERELGYAYYCRKCCNAFYAMGRVPERQRCGFCGSEVEGAGPLWLGALKGTAASRVLADYAGDDDVPAYERKFAAVLAAEPDVPLYYSMPHLTKSMGIPSVPIDAVIDALRKSGSLAARTSLEASCIKTDAEIGTVRDAVKNAATRRPNPKLPV